MEKEINDKVEKVENESNQKGKMVLEWIGTALYFIILILFVYKPLTEFMLLIEYNVKAVILNYLIN